MPMFFSMRYRGRRRCNGGGGGGGGGGRVWFDVGDSDEALFLVKFMDEWKTGYEPTNGPTDRATDLTTNQPLD